MARSVTELSQKGQVVPVHLSVFAEMVKGQEWTPATLHNVGGWRGLGVKFLDKAFGESSPPYRRTHLRAGSRGAQAACCPEAGSISRAACTHGANCSRRPGMPSG